MKHFLHFLTIFLFSHSLFAQSNSPCSAGLITAPSLLVGATCNFTNGTTVGATAQTNAANGGNPSCGQFGPDVWYSFIAPLGGQVVIQTQAGTITDGVMSLYSGGCGSLNQIACDDNSGPGSMPLISATGLTAGQVYLIRFWQYGGGTGTFGICASAPALVGTNAVCANQVPICSGSPITFTANAGGTPAQTANPGNNYGCLFTTPNPSWYYLQIANPGNLVVDITAGSDVDFAIWGPFPSIAAGQAACNNYAAPIDCSYSTAAVEQVNVPNVLSGQVFVLLVTNYASIIQNIAVNNGGGTATTNCSLLPLPVELTVWEGKHVSGVNKFNWTTQSETNNDYFLVQRTVDGSLWETLGSLDGAGTTTAVNHYSFTDEKPFIQGAYYRLKQVDLNGNSRYSQTIFIKTEQLEELGCYPNPSKEIFQILVPEGVKHEKIKIIDSYGRTLDAFQVDSESAIQIQLPEEFKGIAFVELLDQQGNLYRGKTVVE